MKSQSMPQSAGFALIEILMVVATIGLLVALLAPSLHHARAQAHRTMCLTNLKQIGVASWAYATAHRDRLPDADLLGRHSFRRAPGEVDPRDRGAIPERYGLAAILDRTRNLPGRSDVWICPAQSARMKQFRNTYAFSVAAYIGARTLDQIARNPVQRKLPWVWDNFNFKPGLTGFKGPFTGYNFSSDEIVYPHVSTGGSLSITRTTRAKATCALYVDGHAGLRRANE